MNFRLTNPKLLFSLFIALAVVGVVSGLIPSRSGAPLTAQLTGDIPAVRTATRDSEIIDCGNQQITSASLNNGIGILVRNVSNVTVRNCQVRNFWVGLFAENAPGLTVYDSNFSNNAILSSSDSGFIDKRRGPYISIPGPYVATGNNTVRGGGGIVIQNSSDVSVSRTTAINNFSGIELYNISEATIENNNLYDNLGFGAFLYNTDNSVIQNNNMFNIRYPWDPSGALDNAALMMIHDSDNNQIIGNNLSNSADGLFLSNAESPNETLNGVRAGSLTSDYNIFRNNIAENSPHNAFEVVFSYGNVFENNTASNSNYGFWITYGNGHRLTGNTISGNRTAGIELRQTQNYTITGNTITNTNPGPAIAIRTDASHNWKPTFPANNNITITGNTINSNIRGIHIEGDIQSSSVAGNTMQGNSEGNITGSYNAVSGTTITESSISSSSDTCETVYAGAAPHPYVITFISDGFENQSVVKDNFLPLCTGAMGPLNPNLAFPDISRALNLPNLGIFSLEPFRSARNNFNIQFVRTSGSFDDGCSNNGQGCNINAIKQRVTAACPNTNLTILFHNDGFFGWTSGNSPNPFTPGSIPLIAIGVSAEPSRITNEHWGVCSHEFGHAFGYLADEITGSLSLAATRYETNRDSIANCALPSECASKFDSASCVAGCGNSTSLSRPRANSIMNGVFLNTPDSLTFNQPSINRLSSLLNNTFFATGIDAPIPNFSNNPNQSTSATNSNLSEVTIARFNIKNGSSEGNILPSEIRGSFSTALINEILDNNVFFSFSTERNGVNTSPSWLTFSPPLSYSTGHYGLTSDIKSFGGIRPNQTIEVSIKASSSDLSSSDLSRLFITSTFNIDTISYDYYPRINSSDKISYSWSGNLLLVSEE